MGRRNGKNSMTFFFSCWWLKAFWKIFFLSVVQMYRSSVVFSCNIQFIEGQIRTKRLLIEYIPGVIFLHSIHWICIQVTGRCSSVVFRFDAFFQSCRWKNSIDSCELLQTCSSCGVLNDPISLGCICFVPLPWILLSWKQHHAVNTNGLAAW